MQIVYFTMFVRYGTKPFIKVLSYKYILENREDNSSCRGI